MGYETDLKLFIDGVWKSGEGRDSHDVLNPVTASPIAAVPYATKADLEEALAASARAWPEWRSTDVEKRGAILFGNLLAGSVEQDHALAAEVELHALARDPGLTFLHACNEFLLRHCCFLPCQ